MFLYFDLHRLKGDEPFQGLERSHTVIAYHFISSNSYITIDDIDLLENVLQILLEIGFHKSPQ